MQSIDESGSFDFNRRVLLLAVDDNDECERALSWLLDNLYRPADVIHLLHVTSAAGPGPMSFSAPAVDELPSFERKSAHDLHRSAEVFVSERFLSKIGDLQPAPVVHILQSTADSDNVGNIICRKAEELAACTLVMAGKRISSFEQFMIGSVLRHCTIHSKMPVTIVQ